MKPIAYSGMGLALVLVLAGIPAGAQNQPSSTSQNSASGSSLGDYARQVRKDPGATKTTPKVFDNDNLPKEDKLSVVGQSPAGNNSADGKAAETDGTAAAPGTAKTGADEKASSNPKTPEEDQAAKLAAAKQWADKIASQKDQIDLLGRELDVLQREYQIRAAAMYADAGNRLRNSADWDKQDAQYKQQIADKQKALDDAKQKLDDQQEDARKAGVPSTAIEPQAQ
jgi:hypothetical protein